MASPSTETHVKRLVEQWYFLLDAHADVQELLPLLADEGLEMRFPETTILSKEAFTTLVTTSWYQSYFDEMHVLQSLKVSPSTDGMQADVQLVVKWLLKRWRAPLPRSEWLGFDAFQRLLIVSQSDELVIQRYIVDELRPLAGSAAL
jgi:hypothetical protein